MNTNKIDQKLIVIILLFLISSCSSNPKESLKEHVNSQNAESVVAIMLPLSGRAQNIGKAMLDSASLAIFSDNSTNISLEVIDTNDKNFDANLVIQNLALKKTKMILGPLFYDQSKEVGKIAKKYNIPIISFSNNDNLAKDDILSFGITPEFESKTIISYANKNEKIEEFYAILPENIYGKTFELAILSNVREISPLIPVLTNFYESEDSMKQSVGFTFDSMNINQNTKKALIIVDNGDDLQKLSALINNYDKDNLSIFILDTRGEDNYNSISLENYFYVKHKSRSYSSFEKQFLSTYGYKPPFISVFAYDASSLIADFLIKSPKLDFYSFLENITYNGISFKYSIAKNKLVYYDFPVTRLKK